jgi:hypothetical protein
VQTGEKVIGRQRTNLFQSYSACFVSVDIIQNNRHREHQSHQGCLFAQQQCAISLPSQIAFSPAAAGIEKNERRKRASTRNLIYGIEVQEETINEADKAHVGGRFKAIQYINITLKTVDHAFSGRWNTLAINQSGFMYDIRSDQKAANI